MPGTFPDISTAESTNSRPAEDMGDSATREPFTETPTTEAQTFVREVTRDEMLAAARTYAESGLTFESLGFRLAMGEDWPSERDEQLRWMQSMDMVVHDFEGGIEGFLQVMGMFAMNRVVVAVTSGVPLNQLIEDVDRERATMETAQAIRNQRVAELMEQFRSARG